MLTQGPWLPVGGAGIVIVLLGLIYKVMRLGVNQEKALVAPAYRRIKTLEDRMEMLEAEQRKCRQSLGRAMYLLAKNNIPFDEVPV